MRTQFALDFNDVYACLSVKDAGRDFTYLIVVLIGLGVTGEDKQCAQSLKSKLKIFVNGLFVFQEVCSMLCFRSCFVLQVRIKFMARPLKKSS